MPVLYRGDTRTPAQIQLAGGFHGWIRMTDIEARNVVTRYNGVPPAVPPNLAIAAAGNRTMFLQWLNANTRRTLNDLMVWIKGTRDQGETPQVSTDEGEDCGGYADGKTVYVYQITFPHLNMQANGAGPVAVVNGPNDLATPVNPKLVFDGGAVGISTNVGLSRGGQGMVEVAWLTSIPYNLITGFKAPNGGPHPGYPAHFAAMP